MILFVLAQGFDPPAAKDKARSELRPDGDQDMRYTVQFNDPAWQLATPAGVALTPHQKQYLSTWRYDSQEPDPSGYDLPQLLTDLRAVGGANLDEQFLLIKLEGRRNQPIFIDNVRPVNIKRTEPYAGTLIDIPPQEGGETTNMIFNLDELYPRPRAAKGPEGGPYTPGGPFFNGQTLKVEDGKEDTIMIQSITTRKAVTFDIQIDYRLGGRHKELTINNRGKQFAVTPFNCTAYTKEISDDQELPGRISYQDIWGMYPSAAITHAADPHSHPYPRCDRRRPPVDN